MNNEDNPYGINYEEMSLQDAFKIKDLYDKEHEENGWKTDTTIGFNSVELRDLFIEWFYNQGGDDAFWDSINESEIEDPKFDLIT